MAVDTNVPHSFEGKGRGTGWMDFQHDYFAGRMHGLMKLKIRLWLDHLGEPHDKWLFSFSLAGKGIERSSFDSMGLAVNAPDQPGPIMSLEYGGVGHCRKIFADVLRKIPTRFEFNCGLFTRQTAELIEQVQ